MIAVRFNLARQTNHLVVPDSQVLVEKIVRLQRQIAKKQEKLDFLEEHTATMSEEVKKKNRIIVEYVMKAEAGILSTDNMDENKVSGVGQIRKCLHKVMPILKKVLYFPWIHI